MAAAPSTAGSVSRGRAATIRQTAVLPRRVVEHARQEPSPWSADSNTTLRCCSTAGFAASPRSRAAADTASACSSESRRTRVLSRAGRPRSRPTAPRCARPAQPSISDGASNHAVATPSTTRQSVPIPVMPGTVPIPDDRDHGGDGPGVRGGPSLRLRRAPGMPTHSRSRPMCRLRCSRSRVHRIGIPRPHETHRHLPRFAVHSALHLPIGRQGSMCSGAALTLDRDDWSESSTGTSAGGRFAVPYLLSPRLGVHRAFVSIVLRGGAVR